MLSRQPQLDQQVEARERRGAGAGYDQPDVGDVLADYFEAVDERRAYRDRGAVLVVVEYGDAAAFAQLALDDEALGRFDVFEVDAAERRLEARDDVDQLVGITLVDFDIEHVDARELLEQHRLAFHHGLGRERADVAETEHRSSVCDHAHEVAARRHIARLGRVGDDQFAGRGHTGRVRKRQIMLVQQPLGRGDGYLAGRGQPVIVERAFAELFVHGNGVRVGKRL